jgi:hypothetical protein
MKQKSPVQTHFSGSQNDRSGIRYTKKIKRDFNENVVVFSGICPYRGSNALSLRAGGGGGQRSPF